MALPMCALRRRPFDPSVPLSSSFSSLSLVSRRNQSSYRRTKQRLRVKPDPSFAHSPDVSYDHIIHNPPSSAPSVSHTPTKFLPPNDIRRSLRTDSQIEESKDVERLPVLFKNVGEKKKILSAKEIEEIRKLRHEDPMTWSRGKLAKKFGCNPVFISTICQASQEKRAIQARVLEAVKSRWGKKRTMAREDRQLRKELWARDR